jgi:3'-phosphoadenosine 5'-phosphosulfate sulfotransferase (PAPS reductase)/FAD synthetase
MTTLTQLEALEAEAVFVMREVAAEFERPVLLFSGGKDSIVLLRLAEKAFRPAPFPCPILHVDTVTGAVRSDAADVEAIIAETAAARTSERDATRADDRTSSAAMEDRKREGYF